MRAGRILQRAKRPLFRPEIFRNKSGRVKDDYSQTFSNQLLNISSAQHIIIIHTQRTQSRSLGNKYLARCQAHDHTLHISPRKWVSPRHKRTIMLRNVVMGQNVLITITMMYQNLVMIQFLSFRNIPDNNTHSHSHDMMKHRTMSRQICGTF